MNECIFVRAAWGKPLYFLTDPSCTNTWPVSDLWRSLRCIRKLSGRRATNQQEAELSMSAEAKSSSWRLYLHREERRTGSCEPPPKDSGTYQGSNSWMMLSKRITAKSRELKPASQARKRMVNDSRDCHAAGCVSPPDRPPLPETGAPAPGVALCLLSATVFCSAMFCASLRASG